MAWRCGRSLRHFTFPISNLLNRLRFGAGAPLADQTIFVDPAKVTASARWPGVVQYSGRVLGGDWDRDVVPFDQHPVMKICAERLAGRSWEEAGAYDRMLQRIAELGKSDRCRTRDDVVRRYERLDSLIAEVRQTGRLKAPREVYGPDDRSASGVYISIGRNGELFFGGRGSHRLAIAKLLRLPVIPATLAVVHPLAIRGGVFRQIASRLG